MCICGTPCSRYYRVLDKADIDNTLYYLLPGIFRCISSNAISELKLLRKHMSQYLCVMFCSLLREEGESSWAVVLEGLSIVLSWQANVLFKSADLLKLYRYSYMSVCLSIHPSTQTPIYPLANRWPVRPPSANFFYLCVPVSQLAYLNLYYSIYFSVNISTYGYLSKCVFLVYQSHSSPWKFKLKERKKILLSTICWFTPCTYSKNERTTWNCVYRARWYTTILVNIFTIPARAIQVHGLGTWVRLQKMHEV